MKKIITLILTLTLILTALTGCTSQNPDAGDGGDDKLTNPVITINSFENYDDLHRVVYGSLTGRIDLSDEQKTTGDKSMKVTVVAQPYITTSSGGSFRQALKNDQTGENYTDFEKVSLVTTQVYNANQDACRLGLTLYYPSGKEVTEYYELLPGQWNTVRYTVNREYIPVVTEGRDKVKSRKVNYILYSLDRGETDRVFYFDDICLYRTNKEVPTSDMSRAQHEIASFDKLWQVKKVGKVCYSNPPEYIDTEWAMLPDFAQRGGLMKAQAGKKQKNCFSYLSLSSTLLTEFDFSQYDANDELCVDIFVPEIGGWDKVYFEFYSYGTKLGETRTITLRPGWNEISFTVDELNAKADGSGKYEGTYSFAHLDLIYMSTLTNANADKLAYFDDIKMKVNQ